MHCFFSHVFYPSANLRCLGCMWRSRRQSVAETLLEGWFVGRPGWATYFARWWFQTFSIFTLTLGDDPIWLILFKWVETTNWLDVALFNWNTPERRCLSMGVQNPDLQFATPIFSMSGMICDIWNYSTEGVCHCEKCQSDVFCHFAIC